MVRSELDLAGASSLIRTCRVDAGRARPLAQLLKRLISSFMVLDNGTVSARVFWTSSVESSTCPLNASKSAEMIASSISAPLKPSLAWASTGRSNLAGSRNRFLR